MPGAFSMPVPTAKPVHCVTNDPDFIEALLHYDIYIEVAARDRATQAFGQHDHILVYWPVKEGKLSPARRTVIKRARRRHQCEYCNGKTFISKCPVCGHYYKLKWSKTEDHTINVKAYIKRKIQEDPTTEIIDNTRREPEPGH